MTERRVCVVDLGGGNLRSVVRAFESLGVRAQLTRSASEVQHADRVVVPGQGAFEDGARSLERLGLGDALNRFRETGRPFLGICLGMQLLFATSEEAPGARGLGWLPGRVKRFATGPTDALTGLPLKVPHMGWNVVTGTAPWFASAAWFYFVHSYYCAPDDERMTSGWCEYGIRFSAAVAHENVFACQFHPEKSQDAGWGLLTTWLQQ